MVTSWRILSVCLFLLFTGAAEDLEAVKLPIKEGRKKAVSVGGD